MEKIAIITDSSCDLTSAYLNDNKVNMLPLKIIYSDREYRDRVEISADEIYNNLSKEVPKTSLASPEDVMDTLNTLKDEGYTHVLAIFISSGLSGTYNMFRTLADTYEGLNIEVIDSKSLSLGLGFIVKEAVQAIKSGTAFNDVVVKAQKLIPKVKTFYVIKTLEYLKKGGRIGQVEGTVGDLLNIKPIISVNEEGVYYTFKKVRGRKKSIQELMAIVKSYSGKPIRVGVLHGHALEEGKKIFSELKNLDFIQEIIFEQISPVLTVHTGPGLLGVAIQEI